MPRHAPPVNLSETDRQELERWVAAHRTPQQVSQRCQVVLAAAQGQENKLIADDLNLNFKTVALWRKRFVSEGPDCLWEVAEGRGRKPIFTPEDVERILDATLQTKPAGATQWSCRTNRIYDNTHCPASSARQVGLLATPPPHHTPDQNHYPQPESRSSPSRSLA